jgi:secretion/DNA translocation related CpaE-like protein
VSDVLLVTGDDALRPDVTRVLAAAGTTAEQRAPGGAVRAGWQATPLVLVGLDAVTALSQSGFARRDGVALVGRREPNAAEWEAALRLGASRLVLLPGGERDLLDLVRLPQRTSSQARVVTVVGGCGGAGASTVAAALAQVAARSRRTVLVDSDPYGGGLDLLLGAEDVPGLRWTDLDNGPEPHLAGRLGEVAGLRFLAAGRGGTRGPSGRLAAAVRDVLLGSVELVVVDVARVPDDAAEAWLAASEQAVVIVPAAVRAVAAAAHPVTVLAERAVAAGVVVRDAGGERLAADDVAASLALPLLGTVRSEPSIAMAAERGSPPLDDNGSRRRLGSLHRFCSAFVERLDHQAA